MQLSRTLRFARRRLPHWEIENGRYFVTVRCNDSLPAEAVARISELSATVAQLTPRSLQFADFQREVFRTVEKYLDAGIGACPLRTPAVAIIVAEELEALADWNIDVPHYSIMPNHWHALLVPKDAQAHPLTEVMKRLKGRAARRIRRIVSGEGAVWQSEWFDRWVRDENEWDRTVAYIRNNPVKAGLSKTWQEHRFTK